MLDLKYIGIVKFHIYFISRIFYPNDKGLL